MIQSILAKILTEKRYERQIQETKNQKHKKIPKKSKTFKRGTSLTQIKIPSFVTSIGTNPFEGCSSLTQIKIPSSITEQMNSDTPMSDLLGINEEDINIIMQQCNVSRDRAIDALQEADGDLVTAVMNLAL